MISSDNVFDKLYEVFINSKFSGKEKDSVTKFIEYLQKTKQQRVVAKYLDQFVDFVLEDRFKFYLSVGYIIANFREIFARNLGEVFRFCDRSNVLDKAFNNLPRSVIIRNSDRIFNFYVQKRKSLSSIIRLLPPKFLEKNLDKIVQFYRTLKRSLDELTYVSRHMARIVAKNFNKVFDYYRENNWRIDIFPLQYFRKQINENFDKVFDFYKENKWAIETFPLHYFEKQVDKNFDEIMDYYKRNRYKLEPVAKQVPRVFLKNVDKVITQYAQSNLVDTMHILQFVYKYKRNLSTVRRRNSNATRNTFPSQCPSLISKNIDKIIEAYINERNDATCEDVMQAIIIGYQTKK